MCIGCAQDEDVIRFFNDAAGGEDSVAAVRVVRDAETNLGKGFAFVLFSTTQGARMAVARDGAELRGRPIRVSRVSSKKRSQPPKSAAAQTASGDTHLRDRQDIHTLLLSGKHVHHRKAFYRMNSVGV